MLPTSGPSLEEKTLEHIEEELTCAVAGCGTGSVARVPVVVRPDETDPQAIAEAPTEPVCSEHVDLLWNLYGAFGAKTLLEFVASDDKSESTRAALQKIATALSTHSHPDSKAKAGLISATVIDGLVLQVGEV